LQFVWCYQLLALDSFWSHTGFGIIGASAETFKIMIKLMPNPY